MNHVMEDYKPNSHKFREEQKESSSEERKKVEKVVSGAVKTRKKNEISKLKDVFVSEDVSNVKSYILMDVLLPTIKNTVWEIITGSLDMALFKGNRRTGKRSSMDYVSYDRFSNRNNNGRSTTTSSTARSSFAYDELIFETRGEAEMVIDQMDAMIERYGIVTVADMFDAAGVTSPYTSNKYGWTNIRSAEPVRLREGGYIIKLPKAMPID